MKILIILGSSIALLCLSLIILYGNLWFRALERCTKELSENPDTNRVIRTDGFLPRLGAKPPESAMWRVRSGMYSTRYGLVFTYRYDPKQLKNADLDDPRIVESEMRATEAHGRSLPNQDAD